MERITPLKAMFCENDLTLNQQRVRFGAFCFFAKLALRSIDVANDCEVGSYAFALTRRLDELSLGVLCRLDSHAFALAKTTWTGISYVNIESIRHFHKKAFSGASRILFHDCGDARYFGEEKKKYDVLVKANRKVMDLTVHRDTRFLFHGALRHCKRLKAIYLPESLLEIGCGVFHKKLHYNEYEGALYFGNEKNPYLVLVRAKDHKITECTVHKNTVFVAQDAFYGCKQLEKIVFLARNVCIHEDVFKDCKRIVSYEGPLEPFVRMCKRRLEHAVIVEGTVMPSHTVDGAPMLSRLVLPETLETIDSNAVRSCPKLAELVIPLSVKTVSVQALRNLPELRLICEAKEPPEGWARGFAKGVRTVCWDGQGSASVGYLIEPDRARAMVYSYDDTMGEEDVYVPANRHGNAVCEVRSGAFAAKGCLKKIRFAAEKLTIDIEAFAGAEELSSISSERQIYRIGTRAFAGCGALSEIEAREGIQHVDPYAFDGCRSLPCAIFGASDKSVREGSFRGCASIRTLRIPEGIEVIEKGAFAGCTSLSELSLPSTLKRIESEAFMGCTSLAEVMLPAKIDFIGARAFMDCTSLVRVGGEGFVKQISPETFRGCSSLQRIAFFLKIERLCERAFMGCRALAVPDLYGALHTMDDECFAECTSFTHVEISSNITHFGKSIFRGCTSLVSFGFTKRHTKIPEGMFEDCGFKTVSFPENIQVIGRRAFAECHELSDLVIPKTVKRIEPYAFHKCGNMNTLTLTDGIETVAEYAFAMCGSLREVHLGDGVETLAPYAFAWCGKLTDVEFGKSLRRISEGALAYCNALLALNLPEGLTTVEQKAFFYSRNLKVVWIPKSVLRIGAEAFAGCDKVEARCAIDKKPSGWESGWISDRCDVSYGVKE